MFTQAPETSAVKLLDYSFADIQCKYDDLTEEEKEAVGGEDNFLELLNWMNKIRNK